MLVPEIGVPIVRVPDRLPVAADPGHVWSVAIAISALPGSTWAAPYITAFLSALRTAVNAKIDVAVFTPTRPRTGISRRSSGRLTEDPEVHVHDPDNAKQAYDERSTQSVSQSRMQRRGIRIQRCSAAARPSLGGTGLRPDWLVARSGPCMLSPMPSSTSTAPCLR